MSAGLLSSPGSPSRSPSGTPICSLGSSPPPPPHHPAGQQPGNQRAHYGPLWFVQVTNSHNSTGHAVVPGVGRPAGLHKDPSGAPRTGRSPAVSPMAKPASPLTPRSRPGSPWGSQWGPQWGPQWDCRSGQQVGGRLKRRTLRLLTPLDGDQARGTRTACGSIKTNRMKLPAAQLPPPPPPPRADPRRSRYGSSSSSSSGRSGSSSNARTQLHRVVSELEAGHGNAHQAPGSGVAGLAGLARLAGLVGLAGLAGSSTPTPRSHVVGHGTTPAHRDSFHGAMCPALMVAQCFALLPVDGISRAHPGVPQFRWLSFRVFYTVAVFLGTGVVALLAAYRMVSAGLSFNSSVTVVFFGNSLSAMMLFLQLATRWPAVARCWARIEHDMRAYGYPRHLGRKIKIMTAIVLLLAAVEHLLAVMTGVYTSWPCYESGGFSGLVRGYTINNFAMVLQVTEYAPWKAVFVFLLNVVATFSWNYTDLFIMLLSVSLAQRFKQLNHRLRALQGKNLPSGVWRQLRETYNSLACLTRTVDEAVNNIVLLSFASNLYFICVQLLQGMKLILDVYPYVYFFFSFGYLLLRTCVVSLYAASIHDESKEPRRVLYSVPSESFCNEVRRFLAQVTTDDIALTGCNFFSVTRSLMLTVAGTIVTYEIVLVQFQGVSSEGSSNSTAKVANITVRCF